MKTKKLLFVLGLLFVCLQISAQLKVLPNGKVGIGTMNPKYGALEIGKSGVNGGLAIYDSLSIAPPLRLYSSGEFGYLNFDGNITKGITIRKNGRIGLGYYDSMYPVMNHFISVFVTPSNAAAAFVAYVDFPFDYGDVISVVARRKTDMAYVVRSGTPGSNEIVYYVNGDGSVYSKGSLLTASDVSFKESISSINNSLNVIKQMRGVTYKIQEDTGEVSALNSFQKDASLDTLSTQSSVPIEIVNKIKAEKKRKKAGFIAQELEQVFPEAVYTLPNGKKAIAYSEIIPILVEAIKEQQNQIDELKQEKNTKGQTRAISNEEENSENTLSSLDERGKAALYSNIPNPFKEETTISFFIPVGASQASLHIYDLQGKQMKQMNISERGNNSIVIKGYELKPGMYMYSLIVDGKEVDTKKMILTE